MQFEFSVIFVRNFTCLLGKLPTKSMGLIGNSISPEQQRPSFAHCTCTMHVHIVVSFIHVHVAYYLLTTVYLNLQVAGTCTVADNFLLEETIQNSLHCSAVMTSRLVKYVQF